MKTILCSLCCLLFSFTARAVDLTFSWELLPAEEEISEYRLVEESSPGTYEDLGSVAGGVSSITVNLEPGKHTLYVIAINVWGSTLSDPVTLPAAKPSKPGPIKVKLAKVSIETSPDLQKWTPVLTAEIPVPDGDGPLFIRPVFVN